MNHVGLNSKCWVKYSFLIVPYMPNRRSSVQNQEHFPKFVLALTQALSLLNTCNQGYGGAAVRTPGLRPEGSGFKAGACTLPTVNLLESLSDLSLEHV